MAPSQPQPSPLQQQPRPLQYVPDGLLALAKDNRYVKECQALFLQVLSTLLPRRRHPLLEQESWILASILCLALGLRRQQGAPSSPTSTTLGMEAVGLQFNSTTKASRWRFAIATLVALSWAWAFSPHRITSDGTVSDGSTNDIAPQDSTQQTDELLRGQSRIEFHERQRQAMLRRAMQAAEDRTGRNATSSQQRPQETRSSDNNSDNQRLQGRENLQRFLTQLRKRLKATLLVLAQVLAAATMSPIEGPHMIQADINQQQQRNQSTGALIQQAGRWLAKLQLAHYCWTGTYPTWIHRLSGHSFQPSSSTGSSSLYHQPATARLVGLLIGAQLTAAVIQASASAASRWYLHRQQALAAQQSLSSSRQVPSVVFQTATTTEDGINATTTDNNTFRRSICSICKMERKNPSAPSNCGHVFCWTCLQQWVSNVRPECPLCRAACRPQDIVALYNYSPHR